MRKPKRELGRRSIAITCKGRKGAKVALGAEGTWIKALDLMLAELPAVQKEEEEAGLLLSKGSEENRGVNISGCRRRQCQCVLELFGRESQGRRRHCLGGTTMPWMSRWSKERE